jgi:predicted phage terminase large subunit-like protein
VKQAERIARIASLEELASLYEVKRKAKTLTGSEAAKYRGYLEELAKLRRIQAGFENVMTFAKTYFVGENALMSPATPSPPFHYEVCEMLREMILSPKTKKVAIAAPRSHSKTTIATNIFVLWCVCYCEDIGERYFVIISAKQDGARRFLDIVKNEIAYNEKLIADFGQMRDSAQWNALEATANGCRLQAAGAGESIRGLRYLSYRPVVLADDLEEDSDVASEVRVAFLKEWFNKTVQQLGTPGRTHIVYVGTVLSQNSLFYSVLTEMPEWDVKLYSALPSYPNRMDLWEEYARILNDRVEGDNPIEAARIAGRKAEAFYEANKEVLHEGAEVLWPERMSLKDLMTIWATRRSSFLSEYANVVTDATTRLFRQWTFYRPEDVDYRELECVYALDPAMGKTKRSDLTAIVVLGRSKKTGLIYVLEARAVREHPDVTTKYLFSLTGRYKFIDGCVDNTGFQTYYRDKILEESAKLSVYLPCRPYDTRNVPKEDRIKAVEPLLSNGYVRVARHQLDLTTQLETFPKSAKRDLLDALAMGASLFTGGKRLVFGKLG